MYKYEIGSYYTVCSMHERFLKIHISTSSTAQGSGGSFKNRKPIGEVGCCESIVAGESTDGPKGG